MQVTANGAAADPLRTVIGAVKDALTELDGYSVTDSIDDVELAEMIGRLKSLAGVLVSVLDRGSP